MKTIKEIGGKLFANIVVKAVEKWKRNPVKTQDKVFQKLVSVASETEFGKEHRFNEIKNYEDFKRNVPVRDYEGYRPYIEEIKNGRVNVLWKGKPIYFCKTSGTTSGVKYIPLTKASMPNHIGSARDAVLNYIKQTGKSGLINGKMIFVQGSPELEEVGGIPTGRLSGIVAHHVPRYLQKNRLPSYKTNCIDDWETKVDAIVEETINENMTVIGGIPSWIQMYFEKLQEKAGGKSITEIFPNLDLLVLGGVNFDPYENRFSQLLGGKVDIIQLYPASEGFYAYQDKLDDKGLLLLLDEGIFYEFIRIEDVYNENPERISIKDVELGINYAIVVNSNAGLWGYLIGDTVKFTSLEPYKILVSGRIKHFISAFGEHVIAEEIESALSELVSEKGLSVNEFTVAPEVNPKEGELPYHEWFIEFNVEPEDIDMFARELDRKVREKNIYYDDLIGGNVLQVLKIVRVKRDGFNNFMKSKGKLGGQNKIQRLANDRSVVEGLEEYKL